MRDAPPKPKRSVAPREPTDCEDVCMCARARPTSIERASVAPPPSSFPACVPPPKRAKLDARDTETASVRVGASFVPFRVGSCIDRGINNKIKHPGASVRRGGAHRVNVCERVNVKIHLGVGL